MVFCREQNFSWGKGWWLNPYLYGLPDFDYEQSFFAHTVCACKDKTDFLEKGNRK